MSRKQTIHVTQGHIDAAIAAYPTTIDICKTCIIAIALTEQLNKPITVGWNIFWDYSVENSIPQKLSGEVLRVVQMKHEDWPTVKPFSFEIVVPE
jgi:hypothetical protein